MLTPTSFSALLKDLTDFAVTVQEAVAATNLDWAKRPDPDSWSMTEVSCHLRDVEHEVHQSRIKTMLAGSNPFISGVSTDDWVQTRNYRQEDGPAAFSAFLMERKKTVTLLRGLTEADWQRQGTHAFLGPTSLLELVNLAVMHDQAHWEQIQELLAL